MSRPSRLSMHHGTAWGALTCACLCALPTASHSMAESMASSADSASSASSASNSSDEIDGNAPTLAAAGRPNFGALPAPMGNITTAGRRTLYLELVVNSRRTGIISPVEFVDDTPVLLAADLQRAGAQFHSNSARLMLQDLPGAKGLYRASDQSLLIELPVQYLPSQRFSSERHRIEISPAETALLLNYDLQVSGGSGGGSGPSKPQISLFHEARVSGNIGVFSSTGTLSFGGGSSGHQHRSYRRYDSLFRRIDPDSATLFEFGDFITRGFSNASAVRMAGIQISRDFAVRPDIITHPIPNFTGRAALPSTVELLIDGRSLASNAVDPGTFILDMQPPTSGAGLAQLVVTDMHGQSVSTSMPFYITSDLLAPGLNDFSASAGFLRKDYGLRNFAYGPFAASGSLRRGLTNSLTGEIRAEASRGFLLGSIGVVTKISHYGVLTAAIAASRRAGQFGHQIALGYDYTAGSFSIGLRHLRQSRAYADLGYLQYPRPASSRKLSSASANLSLGAMGTIGLNYAESQEEGRRAARFANANYSLPISGKMRLYAQGGRDFSNHGWFATLALNLSLGGRGDSVNLSASDSHNGPRNMAVDYSRPLLSEGGFGWNVGAAIEEGGGKNWRGNMVWRGDAVQLRAGTFGYDGRGRNSGSQSYWAGATGSLVFIDGGFYAANRLSDAFAIVTTDGVKDIPVRYEHQLIGTTNRHGKLFIPTISPWYAGQFSIDPLALPPNHAVPLVERRVAIAAGRAAQVRFPITVLQPMMANLRTADRRSIAVGSAVYSQGRLVTHIGWDGLLYIEDTGPLPRTPLHIFEPDSDGKFCLIDVPWPDLNAENWNIGELLCSASS